MFSSFISIFAIFVIFSQFFKKLVSKITFRSLDWHEKTTATTPTHITKAQKDFFDQFRAQSTFFLDFSHILIIAVFWAVWERINGFLAQRKLESDFEFLRREFRRIFRNQSWIASICFFGVLIISLTMVRRNFDSQWLPKIRIRQISRKWVK